MKTINKFSLVLLTLAASLFGVQAQGLVTVAGGPFTMVASTTSNGVFSSSYVIDVRRQQNVIIEWNQVLAGAGSTVGGLSFVPSIDGSTIASSPENNGFAIVRAPNGTTPVITVTNFYVKGYNYLVLYGVTNGSANIQTNTIRYWVKPNAP